MTDRIRDIAQQARRDGVIAAVRSMPRATLGELAKAMTGSGPYAAILRSVTVADLQHTPIPPGRRRRLESPKDVMLRTFQANPTHSFASGFFVDLLRLRRWTVTELLQELVEAGKVERSGRAGSTRYRLADDEQSLESRELENLGGEA